MADKRLLAVYPEDPGFQHYRAVESGSVIYGYRQECGPILEHVKAMDDAVNLGRKTKNGWKYGGSIPVTFLFDWLKNNNIRIDEFARDRSLRKQFINYMLDRDRRGFIADHGHLKKTLRRR